MIKLFRITNHTGETIELELTHPEKSGIIIKSVDGLGPVKADVNVTEVITNDGGVFNSARITSRNITMKLLFMETEKESIEDIRQKTYRYFPLKKKISIVIENDNRVVKTEGYVESNEPDIWSKTEECNISIICPDPYLYSTEETETVFSGIEPAFEFPFTNNSLNERLLELGLMINQKEQVINYHGDSDIGVLIAIHAIDFASNITIYNSATKDLMKLNTELIAGDTLYINTRKSHKGITLLRDGVEINLLRCLGKGSKWLTISKGDNIFAYTAEKGSSNLQFNIKNQTAYVGV